MDKGEEGCSGPTRGLPKVKISQKDLVTHTVCLHVCVDLYFWNINAYKHLSTVITCADRRRENVSDDKNDKCI